jgi:hypothetical protein
MKNRLSWNRRDFIAKPIACLAASQLLGGIRPLLGQSSLAEPAAPKLNSNAKPIVRTLGRTGIKLPIVSMGVVNADVGGLIPRSYELGIRYFDSAAFYQEGRNEESVGKMIKQMGIRDKVYLGTKIMRPGFHPGPHPTTDPKVYTPAEMKAYFDDVLVGSFKRLQTDYVDILYNHSCDTEQEMSSEGALASLTAAKKAGKARFIGVSSHQPVLALKTAMKLGVYDVVTIQFNYTMANDAELLKTIDEAATSGIGIIAIKTLAGGTRRIGLQADQQPLSANPAAMLKWVLRHESITTVSSGYTNYEQLEQNWAVASNLEYTGEEHAFLSDNKAVEETQFCRQCGQCLPDCPRGVNIPQLMRTHMYAAQYSEHWLAAETLAAIKPGKGLSACEHCASCQAECRHSVNIAWKIQHLKEIASIGRAAV